MDLRIIAGNRIGISFNNSKILLDPKVSDFISFVSHAHSDHSPFQIFKEPIATFATNNLIKVRNPYFESKVVKENEWINFNNFEAKLVSSGHMLGATQIIIQTKDFKIVYTSDVKLNPSLTSKKIKIEDCDILILEATYGDPFFKFPDYEELKNDFLHWVENNLKKGNRIDLGAYQVGKAQEIIKLLNKNNIIPKVSSTIKKYCEVYNYFGIKLKYSDESQVFIKPISSLNFNSRISKACALSGWCLTKRYKFGFPISDHCDFYQLINLVEEIKPKLVLTVHGFSKKLSKEINKRLKIRSYPLKKEGQKILSEFLK